MADKSNDERDEKTIWAEDRTDFAEDRTILANERTFAGWMRTGMAAIAVAIGLRAVFGGAEPPWLPKGVATLFLLASLVIFWSARRNASRAHDRLNEHHAQSQPTRIYTLLALIFSVGAIAVGGVLWTL